MIGRLLPTAGEAVDAGGREAVGGLRREHLKVDANAVVLLPGAGLVVPEGVMTRAGMAGTHGIEVLSFAFCRENLRVMRDGVERDSFVRPDEMGEFARKLNILLGQATVELEPLGLPIRAFAIDGYVDFSAGKPFAEHIAQGGIEGSPLERKPNCGVQEAVIDGAQFD